MSMVDTTPNTSARCALQADIPFAFRLEYKPMAAGLYEIGALGDQVEVIRNLQTGVAQLLINSCHVQSWKVESAKLVFHKYGERYFLRQIWNGQSETGIQLPKAQREEIGLEGPPSSGGPEIVVVAMT